MRRGIFTILSLAALLSISCNTPENYEGEPNIYAVLSTDLDSAVLMIGKTASINDTLERDLIVDTIWYEDTFTVIYHEVFLWNGVSGAEVSLEHSATSYKTRESSVSRGYYVTDTGLSFEPGSLWKLKAKYPDGKTIEAETRIPGAFEIVSPLTDTVTDDDLLTWSESEGAKEYNIVVTEWGWRYEREWVPEGDSYIIVMRYDTLQLRSYFLFGSQVGGAALKALSLLYLCDSLEVCVEALDVNVYDYIAYRHAVYWNPDTNKEEFMHIPGAWGVFGSKTVTDTRRYIFKDTLTDSILPPKRRPHP